MFSKKYVHDFYWLILGLFSNLQDCSYYTITNFINAICNDYNWAWIANHTNFKPLKITPVDSTVIQSSWD